MQANINIKDKELEKEITDFKNDKYRHLSLTKLFVHAVVELMKREK